ncbi:MAG: phosphatase PAP2 family protein [Lactobacillaceae bacterium]|jgi:undecaprenyl-diphosphatase|nr:phosphatase PAP2 family protein [Lactobacillaceae bacterium]
MNNKIKINNLVAFIAFVIFAIIAVGVLTDASWVHAVDKAGQSVVRPNGSYSDFGKTFFTWVTFLAQPITAMGLTAVVAIIALLVKKNVRVAAFIVVNVVAGAGVMWLIKQVIRRARPEVANRLVEENGFSFPSGHSTNAMVFYGGLLVLALLFIKEKKALKIAIVSVLAVIVLAIPISRVYLGVHYPTDVLGGLMLGLIILTVSTNLILLPNTIKSNK